MALPTAYQMYQIVTLAESINKTEKDEKKVIQQTYKRICYELETTMDFSYVNDLIMTVVFEKNTS